MTTKTVTNDIGTEAIKLLRAVEQHEEGTCDAAGTLLAVFGVVSPQGRFADNFGFLNPPYNMWLEDLAYDHGAGNQIPRGETEKSDSAKVMMKHRLRRGLSRRTVPMTEAAHNALLAYYGEKLDLIASIADLLDRDSALYPDRQSFIRRHAEACEKLCQSIR